MPPFFIMKLNTAEDYNKEILNLFSNPKKTGVDGIKKAINLTKLAIKKYPQANWFGFLNNGYYFLGKYEDARRYGSISLQKKHREYCRYPLIKGVKRNLTGVHAYSYVTFGDNPEYFFPLLKNIQILRAIANNFEVVIYCIQGKTSKISSEIFNELGARTIWIDSDLNNNALCGLRFLLLSDDHYETVHMRDADALITKREWNLINYWLNQPNRENIYNIRDHLQHVDLMLAGLFGSSAIYEVDWIKELGKWPDTRGVDQNTANKLLWPSVVDSGVQFDRIYKGIISEIHYSSFENDSLSDESFHIGAKAPPANSMIISQLSGLLKDSSLAFIEKVIKNNTLNC